MKNTDNSTTIKPIMLKIYMQVVSNPLNNFTYAPRVDFLWPKCLNHTMKVKKKRGAVNNITKYTHNSTTVKPTMLKICMQVVSNPLNNFT